VPIDYTKRPSTPAAPAAAAAAPAAGGKVVLTKSAPTVSLTKQGATIGGELRVNLNWNARPPGSGGGGFLKRLSGQTGAIDLDLGCLYELTNGKKGVVQALGNAFRSQNTGNPIISLDGDDRSGANSAGETMRIDLSRLAEIKRILVFAMIYEGVTNWGAADGVVTVYPVGAPPIEVRLDGDDRTSRVCGIALLTNTGGDLAVQREVNYVQGAQSALDAAYGWGMQWHAGHK
jgi:tellurite resistance protein TerA